MDRTDFQRLSKEELIELVLQMQRPPKTSRTSSKLNFGQSGGMAEGVGPSDWQSKADFRAVASAE